MSISMPRPPLFSARLLPVALSLGASMLLHGAVVQVWSSWQAGTGEVAENPAGVRVLLANEQAGQPDTKAGLAPPEPTKTPDRMAPATRTLDKSNAVPVRPVLVSQATGQNLEAPAPKAEMASRVQSTEPPDDERAANPPNAAPVVAAMPPPDVLEPGYVMGSAQNPEPDYPFAARKFGWQGLVRIRVDVAATGQPQQVEVLHSSGHTMLDQAALETIRDQWLFQPARQNGIAVPANVVVPIQFVLRD
jgi:periplasmic protein TonB